MLEQQLKDQQNSITWQQIISETLKPILNSHQQHETSVLVKYCDNHGNLKIHPLVTLACIEANDEMQRQRATMRNFRSRSFIQDEVISFLNKQGYMRTCDGTYRPSKTLYR